MKYLLYTHGGSGNHGCEALVRTAYTMVENTKEKDERIILATYRPKEDMKYLQDLNIDILPYMYYEKKCIFRIAYSLLNRVGIKRQEWYYRLFNKSIVDIADDNTVAISIGGDNYCYEEPYGIYSLNKKLREKGARTVLLGCSIDSDVITDEMIADLKEYNLINARESITYSNLQQIGITDNVVLYPDSAFTLEKQQVAGDDDFINSGKVIGINISPLIIRHETEDGIVLRSFMGLVKWIMDNTDYKIALIPHVVWGGNNDLKTLKELQRQFMNSDRIKLYSDMNCMQIKYIISKCDILVAARTHASIAAYSQCIPTLVVGYSVKAKGLAQDIFGSIEDYVISVQQLGNPELLIEKFRNIYINKKDIKLYLENVMPGYIAKFSNLQNELKSKVVERYK
ncbi:MAG: polysaccharide pyruvyl transferase family protein [Clostridia bacterium]